MNEHIYPMFPAASVTGVSILRGSAVLLQQQMTTTTIQEVYPYLRVPILPRSRKGKRKRGVILTEARRIARLVPLLKLGPTPVSRAVKTASTYRATA